MSRDYMNSAIKFTTTKAVPPPISDQNPSLIANLALISFPVSALAEEIENKINIKTPNNIDEVL